MPLVRIELRKCKHLTYRQEIGWVVYKAKVAAGIGVPANALSQAVSEHDANGFLFDPVCLGMDRSEDLITCNEGRTAGQKKALYMAITYGLAKSPGILAEDGFINLGDMRSRLLFPSAPGSLGACFTPHPQFRDFRAENQTAAARCEDCAIAARRRQSDRGVRR